MIPEKSIRIYNRLEDQRKHLTESISGLPENKLTFKKDENNWSINEILQHLILSESLSLKYLQKKWKYTKELPEKNFLTRLRGNLLILSMRMPVKIKAPDNVNEQEFDQNLSTESLLEKWTELRKEMLEFLSSLDEKIFECEFYKHPLVGKMTLNHMLLFFSFHIRRHYRQVRRILQEQG